MNASRFSVQPPVGTGMIYEADILFQTSQVNSVGWHSVGRYLESNYVFIEFIKKCDITLAMLK